jgi:hypothetical protein
MAEITNQTDVNTLITSYRQNLEFNKSDEELTVAINKAIKESQEFKDTVDKIGDKNKKYWKSGTDKDFSSAYPRKSRTVVNRIFTDIETAVPIISANTPEPSAIGNFDNDIREKIQDGLEIAYEVKYKMQQKLQCLTRHWFLFRLGAFKYRWQKYLGFITENVLPKKLGLDKRATTKDNCEYIWEQLEDTAENLIEKFPKKEKDITAIVGKDQLKSKIKYFEFWGGNGEWVCWIIPARNRILEKKKNPNFDYDTPENNIFQKPQFPYIFLNVFNLGDETSLFDETSLIEESIPVQDGVTQLEQQIIDLNEGQKRVWVASGEAMSEKKAQDLVNKTGDLMVYLDRKAPAGGLVQIQSGKPDASLFNNLSHLLGEIDNIMGIHSTTRGERAQQETLGGRQLLMGSDVGRMDLIVRNVEQVMEEWYNSFLHMIKVYSVEPVTLMSAEKVIELKPEEIPNDVMVMVKKGSTLPTDDRTRMDMAQQLASAGMIDPKTLFEEMGYANVEQRVNDLLQWLQMTGKVMPQQPQMPQGVGQPPTQGVAGQQGVATGGDQQKLQQVQRLRQLMEKAKQLPPDQQAQAVGQIQQIAQQIKGGV